MIEYRQDMLICCFSFIILTYTLFTDRLFQAKFDQPQETISVVVGKRALLPCYVSLNDAKYNGIDSFKVIMIVKSSNM